MDLIVQETNKIEQLLRYILCVASSAEGFEKELSPIQLIKYAYLVDVDYAKQHDGNSYTGIDWQFYHYGPWNLNLFKMIEPALVSAGACRKTIPSIYDKDSVRFYFQNETSCDDLGFKIDLRVQGSVQHYFRKFGNDTTRLLNFVYNTKPMVHSVPNQSIDLSICKTSPAYVVNKLEEPVYTERHKKLLRQKSQTFLQGIRKKIEIKKQARKKAWKPQPRYDQLYAENIGLIDSEINPSELQNLSGTAEIDQSVWKSETRRASDNE